MNKSDSQFRQKYPVYNTRQQSKQRRWRGLIVLGVIIFTLLLNFNPQINAQTADTEPPTVPRDFSVQVVGAISTQAPKGVRAQ